PGRAAARGAGAAGRGAGGRGEHHLAGHRRRRARRAEPGDAVRGRRAPRHRRGDRRGHRRHRRPRPAHRCAAGAAGTRRDALDPTAGGAQTMTGNPFLDSLDWLGDPLRWSGPDGIPLRTLEHLGYTALGVLVAALLAVPIGLYVGHTGRFKGLAVAAAGAARALPTLGLVTLFALLLGIGLTAPLASFVILAIPSLLAGAYSAIASADPATVDAARAQGMTELQILARVEIALGMPLLIGGFRGATVQVVATAMLAAYVGNGGLGRYIFQGLGSQNYPQMIAGSLLVIVLALVLDLALLLT